MNEAEVIAAEERLKEAMVDSNLRLLDQLLSPTLVFCSHRGQITGKKEDLAAHRSGMIQIEALSFSDRVIRLLGSCAVVAVTVHITGTFGGTPATGAFRFLRVWARAENRQLQVEAGQATLIPNRRAPGTS